MRHNRFPLVSLAVVALVVSSFAAARLSSGQSPQEPLKMKVLREKTRVKHSPNESEVAAFKKNLQDEERKLEDSIPKHIPIKIKIKKEKEAGFKDLKNERWAREFALEVTNTGTKPIYALDLFVVTDIKAAAGFRIVFPLTYGRAELGSIRVKAEPTDIPIKPGESISLTIHEGQLDAWDYARRKENRPFPKHLKVDFQFLNFGDGTGYWGTDGMALPNKWPEKDGVGAFLPSPDDEGLGWNDTPPGSLLSRLLAFNLPAENWPVNLLEGVYIDVVSSASWAQTCCSDSNCSPLTLWEGNVCVNCPKQNRPGLTTCGDPAGACRTTVSDYIECFTSKAGSEPYACQTITVLPCDATPPPPPSPTPSPSPSPSPAPTPCPMALPSECPSGVPRDPCMNPDPPPPVGGTPNSNPDGCPFGYQVSGACCIPIPCPQPTPTPPICESGNLVFSPFPTCNWTCYPPLPDPGPIPTPTPEEYTQECIDFYWVWFVSYDGGRTWQPTGRVEYAGCYAAH